MKGQIAVFGGDERTIALMNRLTELKKRNIYAVGFNCDNDLSEEVQITTLEDLPLNQIEYIILPVQGMNEEQKVFAKQTNEWIHLDDSFFNRLQSKTKVITGVANKSLKNLARNSSLELVTLLNRDDLAIKNSIPTAEGALLVALQNTDYTIHGSQVLITGYGRIGQTVSRVFQAMGAKVFVYTKEKRDSARADCNGAKSLSNDEFRSQIQTMDLVINTVPSLIFDASMLKKVNKQTLIIELSSYPGGIDIESAKNQGIEVIIAGGLPGKVAPVTAGIVLADTISEYI